LKYIWIPFAFKEKKCREVGASLLVYT